MCCAGKKKKFLLVFEKGGERDIKEMDFEQKRTKREWGGAMEDHMKE